MNLDAALAAERSVRAPQLERAEGVLLRALAQGIIPGAVVELEAHGQPLWREAYGRLAGDDSPRVTLATRYDLASLTKPLATAAAVMRLLEVGELCLTDPVERFFPARDLSHLPGVTLFHLLTHTSGLPPWAKLYRDAPTATSGMAKLFSTTPEARPGEQYAYSDVGYLLLGEVVRAVSGLRLDAFADAQLFPPLGITSARFRPLDEERDAEDAALFAPTRNCPMREGRTLQGEVHDANCRVLGGVGGHAGLFGAAEDVTRYVRMLLRGGVTDAGERFFSPATVRLITRSQIAPALGGQTLGWFAPGNGMHASGDLWSGAGFSHSGFTGVSAYGNPENGVSLVLLTNAVWCGTGEHIRVRRLFSNAVAAAFEG